MIMILYFPMHLLYFCVDAHTAALLLQGCADEIKRLDTQHKIHYYWVVGFWKQCTGLGEVVHTVSIIILIIVYDKYNMFIRYIYIFRYNEVYKKITAMAPNIHPVQLKYHGLE